MAIGHTLLGMINDLLNISKMESGALQLTYREVPSGEIAHRALEQVRFLSQNNEVKLHYELADQLPTLRVDDEMLRRILVNLMGNAIKFTPSGGTVLLTLYEFFSFDGDDFIFVTWQLAESVPSLVMNRKTQRVDLAFGRANEALSGKAVFARCFVNQEKRFLLLQRCDCTIVEAKNT